MAAVNRRGVLMSVGLGLLLVAATAGAERAWKLPKPVPRYELALETPYGESLPAYSAQGRTFVLGERGDRYVIALRNPTSERVEAVVSVDGRDVISGAVADYGSQRGYILEPYSTIRIDGFRRSLDEVAVFRFSTPAASYSARRGTPQNVGVIGVAFFRERRQSSSPVSAVPRAFPRDSGELDRAPPARRHSESSGASDSSSGAPSQESRRGKPAAAPQGAERRDSAHESPRHSAAERGPSVDNLGTEYGERHASRVVEVSFERRASQPDRLITVRYDDARGLAARGIVIEPLRPAPRYGPDAFPGARFAQPPP